MEELVFGVGSDAWEGAALSPSGFGLAIRFPSPMIQTPSKPNSSQFFAPKLTDLGDPALSDRFAQHPPDLGTVFALLLFIGNCYLVDFSSFQIFSNY